MQRGKLTELTTLLASLLGSDIEVQYSMQAYGITCPLAQSPKDGGSELLELHRRHTERRLLKDRREMQQLLQESEASGIIPYPSPNDVLVGRGVPYQNFAGNRRLNDLIDSKFLANHDPTTIDKFEKTCLYLEVIGTMKESFGGRFLGRTPEGWKVVDDVVARKKVNSAFRSKMAKKMKNNLPSSTSTIRRIQMATTDDMA
jgi:hypothetical protein